MNIYGYVRVSSTDQNEDRQIIAMKRVTVPAKNIFMAYCTKCGASMDDNLAVCPSCGAPNEAHSASQQSEGSNGTKKNPYVSPYVSPAAAARSVVDSVKKEVNDFKGDYQRSMEQMNQSRKVVLSDGEEIVKTYCCAKMVTPRCDGYLTVTNKRIIFEGRGGVSRITQEAWIEGISGINAFYGQDIRIMRLILGIIVTVAGIPAVELNGFLGFLLMCGGLALVCFSFLKCFKMQIHTANFTNSGISLGSSPSNKLGNTALYSLVGRPTEDTDRMINELGAVVKDLQTMGDLAIKKWK